MYDRDIVRKESRERIRERNIYIEREKVERKRIRETGERK